MATSIGTYRRGMFVLGLCLLLALWLVPTLAQGSTAAPPPGETSQSTVDGEPTCPAGTIAFRPQINGIDDTMGGTFSDGYLILNVVINGFDLAWTSNYGMDLFLVHGSDSANVYAYVPEAVSGSGMTPPGPGDQGPVALSHYQFCYDYELRVDATVTGEFTRTYTWDIATDRESTTTYSGFIGDPAFNHDYLVTVDQTTTDSRFVISGIITVYNDTPVEADNVDVSNVLSAGGIDGPVTVICPASTVAAKRDGSAGSMACSYTADVASAASGSSTATAAASNLGSGSETVDVVFGPPAIVGYPTVHVVDNWAGELGPTSGDTTFPFTRSFQCPADKPTYTFGVYAMPEVVNTASILEIPGAAGTTAVNLTCYAPLVSKTVVGTYDERYLWTITKTVNPPSQSGFSGYTLPWSWTVTLGEAFVNLQFAVSGTIVVQNPAGAPGAATIDVSEALDNALNDRAVATVDCDPSLEGNQTIVTLEPGTTGTCNYSAQPTTTTATLQSGFAGEVVYYDWLLVWTRYGPVQEGFEVHGNITVTNPAPLEMSVLLGDTMSDGTPITIQPDPACAYDPATGVLALAASSTATCHYTGMPTDPSSEVNTVTVNLNSIDFIDAVSVVFTLDRTLDASATVTDPSLGFSQIVTSSGLQSFTEYHNCPTDQANYTDGIDRSYVDINIATLAGSDGFTSEAVAHNAVTCYAPVVSTSVETSWKRDWTWGIDKAGSEATVGPILPNQAFLVDTIVTANAYNADSDFQIWGTIWISNPHPGANLLMVNVVSLVSPGIAAEVSCPTLTVPAGGSISCTYRSALPNANSTSNTAAVSMNYGAPASFSNIPATPVTFSVVPTVETDECVTVFDNPYGPLFSGLQVCATGGDGMFATTYTVDVGREICGPYTYHNEASFETNDNREAGSAVWDVHVAITCSTTCTLSPDYWKAHTIYGPAARPNTTWASVGGPDAPFFLSGQTWYEMLWTSAGGSEYNNLAQQYITARLNTLQHAPNGVVPPPDATQALDDAERFFAQYTLAQSQFLSEDVRSAAVRSANILAQFNNGLLGAPPCDEDSISSQ